MEEGKQTMRRTIIGWAVATLVIYLFWIVSARIQRDERVLSFSDFLTQVEGGQVARVTIQGGNIVGDLTNGQAFRTTAPLQAGENFIEALRANDVEIHAYDPNSVSWLGHFISWTPIVIMIAFLMFFMRQAQNPRRQSQAWNEDQRREMKLSILYRLAGGEQEVSEDDIVSALVEPGRPAADAVRPGRSPAAGVRKDVRRALYEMLSDQTVELTREKKFRAKNTSPND